jgi:AAA domain
MQLPTEIVKAKSQNPRKLFIYSHVKRGKTTAISKLPNCLLIDLQSGASYVDGMVIDVVKESVEYKKHPLDILFRIEKLLADSTHKYDYIAIDPATDLEAIAVELGTRNYKNSVLGKNNQTITNVVKEISNGGGYIWFRDAFEELVNMFSKHAQKCFILTGHSKLIASGKKEDNLDVQDVDLTGKIKLYIAQTFDTNAVATREGNQLYLNFVTKEDDITTGSRSPHLRGNKILLSEMVGEKLVTHWDKIFI